jgi:hypothetical protein
MPSTLSPAHAPRRLFSLVLLCLIMLGGVTAGATFAQSAPEPFNPTTSVTVTPPPDGVLRYSTVTIPANVTVTYGRNLANTPITIIATGDVTINGTINIAGQAPASSPSSGFPLGVGGLGGPGGFNGGSGANGNQSPRGFNGDGPGGGGGGRGGDITVTAGGGGGFGSLGGTQGGSVGGPIYGSTALLPLIGGSGGGGGGLVVSPPAGGGTPVFTPINAVGGPGGGGGGAILIAAPRIVFGPGGMINAQGSGGGVPSSSSVGRGGGGGSGGAVRLVADVISGAGSIFVNGGFGANSSVSNPGGNGGFGYIRVEATDYGAFRPSLNGAIVSFAAKGPVAPAQSAQLRIISVGGVAAPTTPAGSLNATPDVTVPATQANPLTIALAGSGLPLGLPVTITVNPLNGDRPAPVLSTPLTGTEASSTATAQVTLPPGVSLIFATLNVSLPPSPAPVAIDGDRIERLEVRAQFGGASETSYVGASGRRYDERAFAAAQSAATAKK